MAIDLPPLAVQYLPVLQQELGKSWPEAPFQTVFAAQIEQESCVSLTSKRCWSPKAELKTSREYGFGLGQVTIAYNADGTERFNNFEAAKKLAPSMKDWEWGNRYDAAFQIRTLVLMDKFNYGKFAMMVLENERMAFSFAAYNGGLGGVLSDRTVCKITEGCVPNRWFNQVENTSKKAKVPVKGYGQSFFQINRGYVRNIMCLRNVKYRGTSGDGKVIICPRKVDKP